ncbi:glycosyltransferase family 39 protein [Chloroflexota bacterium]
MVEKTHRVNRSTLWVVVGLVLAAFALRVYRLDYLSLRGDESFTVLFSSDPLPQLIEGIRNVEPNPPLYYFVLRAAMFLFGQSDFTARYVSVLFGVLAVPLIYQLGRLLFESDARTGRMVGALAALLLAVNPFQIWHGQDVRNYTIWPALSLASLVFLLRALRDRRPSLWVGYVATALLSLYTHYYEVFVLLFQNLYVFLVYWRDRALLKRWILLQAIIGALYLPWLLLGSSRPLTYQDVTTEVPGLLGIARRSMTVLTLGETVPERLPLVLLPVLLLLSAAGLVFAFVRDRRGFAFVTLYLAVPIVCVFLLAQWRPLFRDRYLNMIAPGYYLAFSLGLVALSGLRRGGRVALALGLAALLIPAGFALGHYYYNPAYAKSADWRGLAAYLESQVSAGDVIIENYPDPTLSYYFHGAAERVVLPHRSAVDQVGTLPVNRRATGRALEQLLMEHQRLWLLPYRSEWDPEGYVEGWLDHRATKVHEEWVDVFRVSVYERAEVEEPSIQFPTMARLGNEVELLGYDLTAGPDCELREGETGEAQLQIWEGGQCAIDLTLHWRALRLLDRNYTVFTQLLDTDGHIWAQKDSQPQSGGYPTLDWFRGDLISDPYSLDVEAGAPPGAYAVLVGMYLLETAERLPAYDASGVRLPDDGIPLGLSVQVLP